MKGSRLLFIFLVLALSIHPAFGQILDPVDWEVKLVQTGENEYDIVYHAAIDEGWSIYSQELERDDGPVKTSFYYEDESGYELRSKNEECGPKKKTGHDPFFDMELVKFSEDAFFVQTVSFTAEQAEIKGYLEYMTCDDEKCLPPDFVDFSISAADAIDAASIDYSRDKLCKGTVDFTTSTGAVEPEGDKDPVKPSEVEGDQDPMETAEVQELELNLSENISEEGAQPLLQQGGILTPVKWSWQIDPTSRDDEFSLIFTAAVDEGWQIYSQHLDGDDGPIPTSFYFTEGDHYELLGETEESATKMVTEYDRFFDMDLTKLKGTATFTQKVRIVGERDSITGFLEYMTCNDEECLPPTMEDFSFNLATGEGGAQKDKMPAGISKTRGEGTPVYQEFDYQYATSECGHEHDEEEDKSGMGWILLAGFLGGLLALLTPCVFPMIPLTVSFFTKSSSTKAKGISNAIIYGISIIVIYVLMGMLITGIFGADALNLLSTNAVFNIFFFALFIIFALSFFGLFEITLPASWANKTDRAADKGGLIGIFFMAFTLALVSFSCTGPIIGTLLVETATGNSGDVIFGRIPTGPLVGMFGFSLALALPFALFAAFPGWLNSLPKSGGWMNTVKVTLGFVEVALAFKFLSVADLTSGWKILPYELFLAVWVLCALGLALYFFKIIKFPHDKPGRRLKPVRAVSGALMLLLTAYLASGFAYSEKSETFDTPNMLSGLAPPAGHSYIYPKKCPLNLECYKDFDTGLAQAQQTGKPILLDFTGHGCVNCRKMEDNIWGKEGVYELIRDKYVLISLYVDERTALDSPYVSTLSGEPKRTVGNKWSDFQAIHFNRNSQPYYVLMSPDGTILNEPVAYTPDKQEYQSFLECGLNRYNDLCGNCLSSK